MRRNLISVLIISGILVFSGVCGVRSAWEWNNPQPAGNDLFALCVSEAGYVTAGGDAGLVLEYNGTNFSMPEFRTYERINDICLTGETGVAVCERSDVLIRSVSGWEVNKPDATEWFYGASTTSSGDTWICGDLGKIYRYSGTSWEDIPSNTSATLKDIEMYDDTHGWAVGLFGTARVWNGAVWQYVSSTTSRFLRKVSASGPDKAWVAGDLGTILMWDGNEFVLESDPPLVSANLYGIVAISDSEAWAVGDAGTILHRMGGVWVEASFPELPVIDFRSIDVAGDGTLWLAGRSGFIARYSGTLWERLDENLIEGNDLNDILYHPGRDLLLTAGTDGNIWEFDGSNFSEHTNTFREPVNRLVVDTADDIWAACDGGILLKNTGGTSWTEVYTGNSDNLVDIDFISSESIWTAGGFNDGTCDGWTVLHYDNVDWTVYTESGS